MVDAVVGVLLDKLLAFLVREGQQLLEFDSQFDKLKDELGYMQSYIKEADRMRRKEVREILKLVTRDLRELVYDAEDVIADCYIEFMKQHDGYLLNIVSYCSPRLLRFRLKISKRLKNINQRIEAVKEKMGSYLPAAPSTVTSREKESTTVSSYPILLEEADIVGLEGDASKVENWILESQEPSTIIGIVGMGGIGKTTLARKICNKNRIKNSFKHIISVTVSQNCELEDLLKMMLIKMNVDEKSLRNKEVEDLLEILKEELGDAKYLVVLDDVWGNERSWWDSLKYALPRNLGCCIIVTTRNDKVARTMGAIERHIHRPNILSDDDSWSLFSKIAFAWNGGKCPNSDVAGLGKEIVARCKGLPLAIRVVGGMMREKGDSVSEWRRTLEHVKEAFADENTGELAMSRLELSYEELPAYLKPCFLCFSIFPEDYVVNVDDIVCWWIGEGFVSETNRRTALETGLEYIVELCNRCLLIGEPDLFERKVVRVTIHDLVRDMAIKIARDVSFTCLDERGLQELSAESRRVGIFDNVEINNVECTRAKKSETESKLRALWAPRTVIYVLLNQNLDLRKLKRLKVLSTRLLLGNQEQIIMKDWLYGITSMLNLVSLRLECCGVEQLPDSIGNLHNLQCLILISFNNLKMLPSTITKLDRLIFFQIIGCRSLTCMPEEIGRLSKLERLDWRPYVGTSQKIASHIGQLKKLGQLTTLTMEIENQNYLQELILNVLSELKHLLRVEISFYAYRVKNLAAVSKLNHLISPLQCLEELTLTDYLGESTPIWLSPTSLPNLKFLCILDRRYTPHKSLRYMSPEFWEGNWKIEGLCLDGLDELGEEWIMFLRAMPSLRMVRVSCCPRLKSFPLDVTQDNAIWRKEDDNTAGGH